MPNTLPTVNALTAEQLKQITLTGTAPAGVSGTVKISDMNEHFALFGEATADENGTWSFDLTQALKADGYGALGLDAWIYEVTFSYDVTVTTEEGDYTEVISDTSSLELFLRAAPATVNETEVAQGSPIVLTGTLPATDLSGTIEVIDSNYNTLFSGDLPSAKADGTWSLHLSEAMKAQGLSSINAGSYEVRVSYTQSSMPSSQGGFYTVQGEDSTYNELTVLAPPAPEAPTTPTINAVTIQGFSQEFTLTGTASTAEGAVTTISYTDAQGVVWGRYLTVDANGTWSIDDTTTDGNHTFWRDDYTGEDTWGMTAASLFQANQSYDLTVTTTLNGVSVSDTTLNEVTKLPKPNPTVDTLTVDAGGQITLTGTTKAGVTGFVSIYDSAQQFRGWVSVGAADSSGDWSLDLSSAWAQKGYSALGIGSYDVRYSFDEGFMSSLSDITTNELVIKAAAVPPVAPTISQMPLVAGQPSFTLRGTASTAEGAQTVLSYTDAQGAVWGTQVLVQPNGTWAVTETATFRPYPFAAETFDQATVLLNLLHGAGPKNLTAITTLDGLTSTDTSSGELILLAPPLLPPHVTPLSVVSGAPILLSGGAMPGNTLLVSILDAQGNTLAGPFKTRSDATNGAWSLDVTGQMAAQNLPPLSLSMGVYSVRAIVVGSAWGEGFETLDMPGMELTVTPAALPTLTEPTIKPVEVTQGAAIMLYGTAGAGLALSANLTTEDEQYVLLITPKVEASGTWSFNLSQWLADEGYPALTAGKYDLRLVASNGAGWVADTTSGEITVHAATPTQGKDALVGSEAAESIDLLGGDDLYKALGGDDTLRGGAGADTLSGGEGDDLLIGGADLDMLYGDAGADTFVFFGGDIVAGERVDGGEGVDRLALTQGEFRLGALTLTSVEALTLQDATLYAASEAELKMIQAATGAKDHIILLNPADLTRQDMPFLLKDLLAKGVESISWEGNGTVTVTESGGKLAVHNSNGSSSEFRFGTSADGREIASEYVNGKRVAVTQLDEGDSGNAWHAIVNLYGEDGTLATRSVVYDNGVETLNRYTNGLLVEKTQRDLSADGKAEDWTEVTTNYDSKGQVTLKGVIYDDGRISETTFDNGVKLQKIWTDTSADGKAAKWSSIVERYDASGAMSAREVVYDTGAISQTNSVAGALAYKSTYATKTGLWTVSGTAEDNVIAGHAGADVFVFAKGGFGTDTILDFQAGDKLNLRAYGISGADAYNPALALDDFDRGGYSVSQQGDDLLLDLGENGSILLQDFALAQLDRYDFA